ncbi:hypothetical protein IV454_14360 [Massilia antarctica]|uniref:Serine/threonine protein kinase n=1 Tax=Massilia antarctica TaxID=2765360 RepID=A0AA49AAG0_9BURK|nr:hypothetical protein [Massilia antarctica]QPI52563.1 hypothetical protein IV454_14360 [Massilia antarctica]
MKTRLVISLVALMVGGAAWAQDQSGTTSGTTSGTNATGATTRDRATSANPDRQPRSGIKTPHNRDKSQEERDVITDPRDTTNSSTSANTNPARDADMTGTTVGTEMRGSSGTSGSTGGSKPPVTGTSRDRGMDSTGAATGTSGTDKKPTVPPVR